ncbi:MAG: hypothetical protein D6B27_12455, partial [Gammaproteobacteria bacterium]
MAKTYCKYHPDTPARFHCKSCDIDICSLCYKPNDDEKSNVKYRCPICQRPISSLSMENVITPFWE